MTFALAAAGTGGHVFPALAIAEALVDLGIEHDEIVFFGGRRFEATAVPAAGHELIVLDLAGLKRSLSLSNLRLPLLVRKAARQVEDELRSRAVRVLLGTGGYATVPAGWGAKRAGVPFFVQEQNAEPGLANRIMSRWAAAAFSSFPGTPGLHNEEYVGNPVRRSLADFDREVLLSRARARYELEDGTPTIGVVGGSLGAKAINDAVMEMVQSWQGPPYQIVHLAGPNHADGVMRAATSVLGNPQEITWRVVPFENEMEFFFAASDLVLARAGGMVAEFTATSTPTVLIPGEFGSSGHQSASAQVLTEAGAALTVSEAALGRLASLVAELIGDRDRLTRMRDASRVIGRPAAARTIAARLIEAHG